MSDDWIDQVHTAECPFRRGSNCNCDPIPELVDKIDDLLDALQRAERERDTLLRRVEAAEKVCEVAEAFSLRVANAIRHHDEPLWVYLSDMGEQLEARLSAWRSASEGAPG